MRKIFFPPRLVFFTFLILSLLMATSAMAATITAGELYTTTCPVCGVKGNATVTVAPTCITDGVGVMGTRNCDCAATVVVPASAFDNHSWNPNAVVEATCTTDGMKGERCTYCQKWHPGAEVIPATGHTWGSWEHIDGTGNHKRTCTVCNATETDKCSYVWQEASTAGYHVKYCAICGDYDSTGKHSGGTATCTQKAVCTTCGMSYGSATGHDWSSWVANGDSFHKRTCQNDGCDAEECLDHDYGNFIYNGPSLTSYNHYLYCPTCGQKNYSWCTNYLSDWVATGATQHTCTCSICGGKPVENHNWSDWTRVDGDNHQRTCSDCGYVQTASHTWGDWENNGAAYSNTTNHKRTCNVCGETQTQDHTYPAWIADDDTTCSRGVCTICNGGKPLQGNHEWGAWSSTDSTHSHTCERCNHTVSDNHTWGSWVITDPTCYKDGSKTRTCTVCGYAATEAIPATGNHVWGEWTSTGGGLHKRSCQNPGCTATDTASHNFGKDVYNGPSLNHYNHVTTCADCGEQLFSWCTLSAWTATGATQHTATCSVCGGKPTESHTWGEWVVTDPTCAKDGSKTRTCTVCGYADTVTLPATGKHTWGEWKADNEKTHTHTCTVCGATESNSHSWQVISVTPATCISRQVTHSECTVCGAGSHATSGGYADHTLGAWEISSSSAHVRYCSTEGCTYTETAGHTLTDWTAKDNITHSRYCTAGCGYTEYENHYGGTATCCSKAECVICGRPYGDTASTHNWQLESSTTGNCVTVATQTYRCPDCQRTEVRNGAVNPTVHTGNVTVKTVLVPTCTSKGMNEVYCADCSALLYTDPIDVIPHTPKMTTIVEPTCCEDGYSQLICTECHQEVNNGQKYPIDATGDHIDDWRETTAATCTTGGVETLYCGRSNKLLGDTRSTDPLGHLMGEPVVTPATCIAEGKSVATCQRPGCTYSETETLPMVDHVEGEPVDDPKPTCCEPGLRSWDCVNCDTLLRTEVLPALGHKDGEYEWVTTKEPTCTEEGEEKKVCAHSGKDLGETRTIPALGHIYVGLWEVGESDTHHRDCYRCGAGRRNVECTYLPLIIDDVEYQVCPVCGRFHNQKVEVVAEADITIVTGSKPGVSLVRMLADPFGADEIRYPAIMTAIFEAEGYIADPDQNVTGITVILPVDAMASFKLVFVHMDNATGELVWTDVPYTLENGILTFAVEEMGLFLFVAE